MNRIFSALWAVVMVVAIGTTGWALGERVQVTMHDGNVFQGILSAEADRYIMLRISDYDLTLQRESIAEIRLLFSEDIRRLQVEPIRAMWSSLIFPGLGQFLNGDVAKGFIHLGPAVGLMLNLAWTYRACTERSSTKQLCTEMGSLVPALVPYMAWSFYSASDAYLTSERKLKGH